MTQEEKPEGRLEDKALEMLREGSLEERALEMLAETKQAEQSSDEQKPYPFVQAAIGKLEEGMQDIIFKTGDEHKEDAQRLFQEAQELGGIKAVASIVASMGISNNPIFRNPDGSYNPEQVYLNLESTVEGIKAIYEGSNQRKPEFPTIEEVKNELERLRRENKELREPSQDPSNQTSPVEILGPTDGMKPLLQMSDEDVNELVEEAMEDLSAYAKKKEIDPKGAYYSYTYTLRYRSTVGKDIAQDTNDDLILKGKYDEVIKRHKESIKTNREDGLGEEFSSLEYSSIGELLCQKGDYDESIKAFKKNLELRIKEEPRSSRVASAHCHLGEAYYLKGDFDKAIACYDNAIESEPDTPVFVDSQYEVIPLFPAKEYFHMNKGYALLMKEDYKGAIQSFEKAISLESKEAREACPGRPDIADYVKRALNEAKRVLSNETK